MKGGKTSKLTLWQKKCKDGSAKCAKCPETRWLTVDHIVPCHILEQFALDRADTIYEMEENFEILCRYCNQQKGARIDPRNPKTYVIFEKLLAQSKQDAMI